MDTEPPASGDDTNDTGVTVEEVEAVLNRTSLASIELTRYSGKSKVPLTDQSVLRLQLDARVPEFSVGVQHIRCRFSHRFTALSEDGAKVASIRADHLLTFDLSDGPALSEAAVATWAETNVFFMAYPYLREAVQSMSIRMGLDPIILGVLRREELRPAGRTELVRSRDGSPVNTED